MLAELNEIERDIAAQLTKLQCVGRDAEIYKLAMELARNSLRDISDTLLTGQDFEQYAKAKANVAVEQINKSMEVIGQ